MKDQKLKLLALISLVVGSMLGSGIFSLPQNTALEAGKLATILAWGITGLGMISLVYVFIYLGEERPDLSSGIYSYAKEGYGYLVGFSSAWGYWLSAVLGNVTYLVLIFSTLGYFFPVFGQGNTEISILLASVIVWLTHLMILKGIKEASNINTITTISKIIPIVIYIIITICYFDWNIFISDFWGLYHKNGSLFNQVKNMMITTVWVFIGIEGANLFANRAERQKDVSRATISGFLLVFILLVLVNLSSMGIMDINKLKNLGEPSTGYILKEVVGPWGFVFMSFGLLISLFGALLAWLLFSAEIIYAGAKDKSFPKIFYLSNENDVPKNALLISNIFVQIFLIMTYFLGSTYSNLFSLATSMILVPYFLTSLFAFKNARMNLNQTKRKYLFWIFLSLGYSSWLIYAAGLKYLLLSSVFYLIGIPLHIWVSQEYNREYFKGKEIILISLMVISATIGLFGLYYNYISI